MRLSYNVDMKVDPLVVKWMDARFEKRRGIYRMGASPWYGLVSMALCQSARSERMRVPPDKYNSFVPVKVSITEYDFYHYGWEVSPTQEIRLSRMIRSLVEDELLRNAAIIRARYNLPLSQAIGSMMVFYNLSEEDVRFETMRKTYRRHYAGLETEYAALDSAAVTDFGAYPQKMEYAARKLRMRLSETPANQMDLFRDDETYGYQPTPTIWKT